MKEIVFIQAVFKNYSLINKIINQSEDTLEIKKQCMHASLPSVPTPLTSNLAVYSSEVILKMWKNF